MFRAQQTPFSIGKVSTRVEPPFDLRHRPTRLAQCGLCRRVFGKALARTKDHVIPKGFFGDLPPPNLPTWSLCRSCQLQLEPREDRLRNLFASAHSHHPGEIRSVTDRAARASRQPVAIARKLVESPAGLMVPASIAIPDQEDIDRVFQKIASGLYWWRHDRLPDDRRFAVRKMSAPDFGTWSKAIVPDCGVQRLGAEFWWSTACDPDDLSWCVWLFSIFGAVGVGVWYGAAAEFPNVPNPSGIALREGDIPGVK